MKTQKNDELMPRAPKLRDRIRMNRSGAAYAARLSEQIEYRPVGVAGSHSRCACYRLSYSTPLSAIAGGVASSRPCDQFKVGETVEVKFQDASPLPWAGVTAQTAAWLRRNTEQDFTAFSVNCTHLGCPVNWIPDGNLFMCPCHGGVYYKDGRVAARPPPNPLPTYPVRVQNGQVEVLASGIPLSS